MHSAVLEATRLHCSVGIGDTLVRAKVATGFGKPRGVFRLTAENRLSVSGDRPTIELWGVGTKISRRLAGLRHPHRRRACAGRPGGHDRRVRPADGPVVRAARARRGRERRIDTPWVARGHSRETTFNANLEDRAEVDAALDDLPRQVLADVAAEG